jgi:hypothetical protein
MSAHVFCGRAVARFGLVAAMTAGLSTLAPGAAHAARDAQTAAVPAVVAAGPVEVPASSTSGTWHMNETNGTDMLDSTGIHLGKMHNVTLGGAGRQSSDGTDYSFNGHSSYVSIPSDGDLNAGDSDVHIAFNLKTSSVPAKPDYDLFRKGQAPGPEYKVELQPNGQVSCHFKGDRATGVTVQAGPDLHDGRWHEIKCERLSSSVSLTVDGVTYSKSRSVGYISNDFDVIVGAYPGGDFYKGEMDELNFSIGSDTVTAPTTSSSASKTSGSTPLKASLTSTSVATSPTQKWRLDGGPPHPRRALPSRSRPPAASP